MRIWLHVLYDHKTLMIDRINHMFFMKYMENDDTILDEFISLQNLCLVNRNLFIKYQSTKNKDIINRIIDNIRIIKCKDQRYMQKFMCCPQF